MRLPFVIDAVMALAKSFRNSWLSAFAAFGFNVVRPSGFRAELNKFSGHVLVHGLHVFAVRLAKNQIANRVIASIAVEMVNAFRRCQETTKMLFHDKPMFVYFPSDLSKWMIRRGKHRNVASLCRRSGVLEIVVRRSAIELIATLSTACRIIATDLDEFATNTAFYISVFHARDNNTPYPKEEGQRC